MTLKDGVVTVKETTGNINCIAKVSDLIDSTPGGGQSYEVQKKFSGDENSIKQNHRSNTQVDHPSFVLQNQDFNEKEDNWSSSTV